LKFPRKVLRAFLQIPQLHRRGKEATKQFLHVRVGDRISPHRHIAIGGTRIKFFKSSPPSGDRRHRYQISSRRGRELKDLLALSECRRERDLKDLLALIECRRERDLKDLLALSECRRERDLKDLLALCERMRERDFKVLLALNERRQVQITRPLCVSELRQVESPQCIRGGGDVTPGQVEASGKVLLTLE